MTDVVAMLRGLHAAAQVKGPTFKDVLDARERYQRALVDVAPELLDRLEAAEEALGRAERKIGHVYARLKDVVTTANYSMGLIRSLVRIVREDEERIAVLEAALRPFAESQGYLVPTEAQWIAARAALGEEEPGPGEWQFRWRRAPGEAGP